MSNEDMPELRTSKEVCRAIKASPSTLKRYRDAGLIDYIQIGRNIRFTTHAIIKFIDERAKKSG